MKKETYNITGMSCASCSAAVTRAVEKLEGAKDVNVNLMQNKMTLELSDGLTDEMVIKAVEDAGYGASVKKDIKSESSKKQTDTADDYAKELKLRAIVSFIFMVPLMYFGMGGMFNVPFPKAFMGDGGKLLLALTELLLVIPIIFTGRKFFISGFKHLFKRNPNMDTLIAIGSGTSFLYSIYSLYMIAYFISIGDVKSSMPFGMNLYFDTAGTILTLITLGKYLEARSKKKTTEAISKLVNLIPDKAVILRDGVESEVLVSEVVAGDIVVVKAGETVPVDGVIVNGSGAVDEAMVTGESIPVEKNTDDRVTGGTISRSGYFSFRATNVGEDTALYKIISLVEEAAGSKAPISRLADKISGVFVPVVLCISFLTFIIWLFVRGDFSFALNMAVAVLVISCPCALGLATPAAIMAGTGKGAEKGIIIRNVVSLEVAHKIDTVVLDKTGTITEGRPKVTDIFVNDIDETEFISLAATLESASSHPLANAVTEYAKAKNIEIKRAETLETIEGRGIAGEVEGLALYAGNAAYMQELGITDNRFKAKADELHNLGKTVLYFARGKDKKELIGIIAVADVIKEGSKEAVRELNQIGIDVVMLTGDNERTALAIGRETGVNRVVAEVKPIGKEAEIRRLKEKGKTVMMVGDGINDAPALAGADVGVAIGTGADVAVDTADIILMHSDLRDVPYAILLSNEVVKKIKENLFWALFYNALCIPVAAGVFFAAFGLRLNPMIGALAMSFSSVFVLSNSLRLRFFTPKYKKVKARTQITQSQPKQNEKKAQTDETKDNSYTKEDIVMEKTIDIEGMSCAHCVKHVTEALNAIDGVKAEVSLENKNAKVSLLKEVSDDVLKEAVVKAGYEVKGIH
ncbi:heavy metal translocating P-type ATPase [Catonella massiliensis]|uniref:Copper-exporting P-type ATPase n=1 Tax=Catonella massiliensis TaxID=2799636 RepID=A0ABS1J1J1_9FIRM|nr:heavy metal translocating P-type ATPase [Catonella massiliensis]MBK5898024.1 heavy metal translocating P-type ATPase [Catonella massiliensis]